MKVFSLESFPLYGTINIAATELIKQAHKLNIQHSLLYTGTVVGSTLGITGFGLSFFTFGASLGLTIAGTALTAAGGTTVAGANIGYLVVSGRSLKHAKMAVETDQEMMEKAKELNDQLKRIVDSLVEKYPALTRDDIFAILCNCARYGKAYAKVLWTGYKLVDGGFDVGRTIATIAGGTAGRTTVWAGLSTAKRAFSVAGAVIDVVSIPLDLYVMIKASIDVHKFKTTGESNSDVANEIGGFIKQLEEHRDELIKQCSVN